MTETKHIPLSDLHATRGNRDLGDVAALRDSMAQLGQLMPLLVTVRPEGGYRIIAGHRRKAAAVLLRLPGLEARVISGDKLDLIHVADNELREGLSLAEKADLASELWHHHTIEEVGKAFGKTPFYVRKLARLRRELPEIAWDRLVEAGRKARVDDWLALLSLPAEQQILRSATNGKKPRARKMRRLTEIERKILDLSARDPRAAVLRWVLHQAEFPGKDGPFSQQRST